MLTGRTGLQYRTGIARRPLERSTVRFGTPECSSEVSEATMTRLAIKKRALPARVVAGGAAVALFVPLALGSVAFASTNSKPPNVTVILGTTDRIVSADPAGSYDRTRPHATGKAVAPPFMSAASTRASISPTVTPSPLRTWSTPSSA